MNYLKILEKLKKFHDERDCTLTIQNLSLALSIEA